MKTGIELITEERERQISQEGWTPEHDDKHDDNELGMAATSYILAADDRGANPEVLLTYWPWDQSYFKPVCDPVRNLVIAGALLAAEIDRISRATVVCENCEVRIFDDSFVTDADGITLCKECAKETHV